MLTLRFLGRLRDFGLLVMRVGLGLAYIVHGSGKVFGGPAMWTQIGGSMANFGVTFAPMAWGILAAMAEFAGGILLILGFLFRPATIFLLFTMVVATVMLFKSGQNFGVYSHPLKMAIVFLGLLFVGPGRYSLDKE
jgi:putative oxidoreductase